MPERFAVVVPAWERILATVIPFALAAVAAGGALALGLSAYLVFPGGLALFAVGRALTAFALRRAYVVEYDHLAVERGWRRSLTPWRAIVAVREQRDRRGQRHLILQRSDGTSISATPVEFERFVATLRARARDADYGTSELAVAPAADGPLPPGRRVDTAGLSVEEGPDLVRRLGGT